MAEESTNNVIQVFQTRVHQLMYEYEKVRNKKNELSNIIEEKDLEISKLNEQIKTLEKSYKDLKTAKMIEINEGDVIKSKQRFEALIRQVDKCIALLKV